MPTNSGMDLKKSLALFVQWSTTQQGKERIADTWRNVKESLEGHAEETRHKYMSYGSFDGVPEWERLSLATNVRMEVTLGLADHREPGHPL